MGLISKTAIVKWGYNNKKWYVSKGYVFTSWNEEFEVKVEDLSDGSTAIVLVQCDCIDCKLKTIKSIEWRNYLPCLNSREDKKYYCKKCMIKFRKVPTPFNKYTYEDIKSFVEGIDSNDCKLLTSKEEYEINNFNVKNQLHFMCGCGENDFWTNFDSFKSKNKRQCNKCSRKLHTLHRKDRITIEMIRIRFKENGLTLVSDVYDKPRKNLDYICDKHLDKGIQQITWNKFQQGEGCWYCGIDKSANSRRLDGKLVMNQFITNGFTPMFKPEDYIKNDQNLSYICNKHPEKEIKYISLTSVQAGSGCNQCLRDKIGESHRLNQSFVFNEFKIRGLTVEPNEVYINNGAPIKFRCDKHPEIIQETLYTYLQENKYSCKYCRDESYRHDYELIHYLRNQITSWQLLTIKHFDNKCDLTDSVNYDIHHIHSFNLIYEETISKISLPILEHICEYNHQDLGLIRKNFLKNHKKYGLGVCIDHNLHVLFHQTYGYGNNTKEQFEDFKSRLYNNEFFNFLKENNLTLKSKDVTI